MPAAVRPRPRPLLGAACLLALSLRPAHAQIRVMAPESLVKKFARTQGRIEGSTSTFGAPFYGERLLGRLVWGDSKNNHTHCREDDYQVPEPDQSAVTQHEQTEVRLIHIIIVRRGKCSFVTKVRVAQSKGAHAVIIVDREDSKLTSRDIRRIIVADDGYGNTIEIPSMLISKRAGNHLIEAAKGPEQVIVELAWDVPTDHVVLVDLWMSSASRESLRFLREFSPKRKALNEAIKFVPHYHVFGMQATTDYNELCMDETAQFCAEDPDGAGPITGRMVLEEDVRQLCIHEIYKVKRPDAQTVGPASGTQVEYSKEYWDYVERMLDHCPLEGASKEKRFGKECSESLMKKVGIDVARVDECALTQRDAKLQEQRENIAWSPRALRINGWRYSGTLDADLVTRAICAGFVQQPHACKGLVEPINHFEVHKTSGSGVGIRTFVAALLVVATIALAAMYLYKRSLTRHIHSALREEVMLEVQAQLDSYKQLGGGS